MYMCEQRLLALGEHMGVWLPRRLPVVLSWCLDTCVSANSLVWGLRVMSLGQEDSRVGPCQEGTMEPGAVTRCHLFVVVIATPGSAQGLVLALRSKITLDAAQGTVDAGDAGD